MSSPTADLRLQLERVQAELASRASILHFAHAAVSLLVAVMLGGAATKMAFDGRVDASWSFAAAALTVALVGYAFARAVWGWLRLQTERRQFESLKVLRQTLQVDDPSALLPQ